MMNYESQIELLSHLLHKSTTQVQTDALNVLIEHLDPPKRNAFLVFRKEAEPDGLAPDAAGGPGFTLADKANRQNLNLNTTKGRILKELRNSKTFSRVDFTAAVAKAMQWDDTKRQFGVESKFQDLPAADRAWWGTLKGKERLVVPA